MKNIKRDCNKRSLIFGIVIFLQEKDALERQSKLQSFVKFSFFELCTTFEMFLPIKCDDFIEHLFLPVTIICDEFL